MAREVNDSMPKYVYDLCVKHLNHIAMPIHDAEITILGLSYLEESDDVRNSPTADLVRLLENKIKNLRVHDSYVEFHPEINHTTDLDQAISGSDVIIIMVAHEMYRSMDLKEIKNKLNNQIIIDTRNILSKRKLTELGFNYSIIGRGTHYKSA